MSENSERNSAENRDSLLRIRLEFSPGGLDLAKRSIDFNVFLTRISSRLQRFRAIRGPAHWAIPRNYSRQKPYFGTVPKASRGPSERPGATQ
jgi:hypothetical protein